MRLSAAALRTLFASTLICASVNLAVAATRGARHTGLVFQTAARPEIRDVLKGSEIDSMLARATADAVLHQRPHYSIWLVARPGKDLGHETHQNADEILFVRRGSAIVSLAPASGAAGGAKRIEAGAGDIVKIPAGTVHEIDPGSSRLEALAVRIDAVREGVQARSGIRPVEHQMADLLKKSEIDATFAKFDSNQPIHSAPNFTMNYVIYAGHSG